MNWYVDCYVDFEMEGEFPVNTYSHDDFLAAIGEIKTIFDNPRSGIRTVVLTYFPSGREWRVHSWEETKEKLGLLILFA